jgi:hypothetical protein
LSYAGLHRSPKPASRSKGIQRAPRSSRSPKRDSARLWLRWRPRPFSPICPSTTHRLAPIACSTRKPPKRSMELPRIARWHRSRSAGGSAHGRSL